MHTIDFQSQPIEVPNSNGQIETFDPITMDDAQWLVVRGQLDGRVAQPIDPTLAQNLDYLRAYVTGATAALAQLMVPTRLTEADTALLRDWCDNLATTITRMRELDRAAQANLPQW